MVDSVLEEVFDPVPHRLQPLAHDRRPMPEPAPNLPVGAMPRKPGNARLTCIEHADGSWIAPASFRAAAAQATKDRQESRGRRNEAPCVLELRKCNRCLNFPILAPEASP